MHLSFRFFQLPSLALGGALWASAAGAAPMNLLPITMGGELRQQNVPFVSLTVCVPGTQTCQTIPDIELDTGSTGLRLFRSALTIHPAPEQASAGDVAECVQFGGGSILWGPVVTADLILGGERASAVPVHIAEAQYRSVPSGCGGQPISDPQSFFGANGLLGISPASTDCDGEACPGTTPGKYYFSCRGVGCEPLLPGVTLQVTNPVIRLPQDNNGVIVSFPALPSGDRAPSVTGSLILGIGTQTDNEPEREVRAYRTDPDGILRVEFGGEDYWSKVDTGTSYWSLPVASGIADCPAGIASGFLCPKSPVSLSFSPMGVDGVKGPPVAFTVADAAALLASPSVAVEGVAWDNQLPESFLIAMPFFYGRKVYVGIDGKASPLSQGPYYAF